MPIYEYACKNCNHSLDALQKMSDDPLIDCPECGEPQLKKLISAPNFRLKGGGWYETDFKKDGQRNVLKSDGESAPSDAKKSEPKASDVKDSTATPKKADTKATSD